MQREVATQIRGNTSEITLKLIVLVGFVSLDNKNKNVVTQGGALSLSLCTEVPI